MALKTIRIGNMEDVHQYDDVAFPKSIAVEDPITCLGNPVDPDDLIKLSDIGNLITGPATATDHAIARFDGATGKLVQNSLVILDDSGQFQAPNGLVGAPTYSYSDDVDTGISKLFANTQSIITGGIERVRVGSNYIRAVQGSANPAAPEFSFIGDTNTGMYWIAADTLGFSTNGINRVQIDGAGKLSVGDGVNNVEIGYNGDVNFIGGAGLKYACINYHDSGVNTTCTVLNTIYQITAFDNNSQYNGDVIPDHTNDHITIGTTGDYQVFLGASGGSTTANNDFELVVAKNNGTVEFTPLTIHFTTPTANKVVSSSILCFTQLTAGDTIEAWVRCTSGANKVWTTNHIVLNAKMIGGNSTP